MNERSVLFSNKIRLKLLGLGLILTLLGGLLAYFNLRDAATFFFAAAMLLAVTGGAIVLRQLVSISKKNQIGLLLDREGLLFSGTPVGKTLGKIYWRDIDSLKTGRNDHSIRLYLRFKTPEKYAYRLKDKELQHLVSENGFPVDASQLDVGFHEMETLIMQYYHQYHT